MFTRKTKQNGILKILAVLLFLVMMIFMFSACAKNAVVTDKPTDELGGGKFWK